MTKDLSPSCSWEMFVSYLTNPAYARLILSALEKQVAQGLWGGKRIKIELREGGDLFASYPSFISAEERNLINKEMVMFVFAYYHALLDMAED